MCISHPSVHTVNSLFLGQHFTPDIWASVFIWVNGSRQASVRGRSHPSLIAANGCSKMSHSNAHRGETHHSGSYPHTPEYGITRRWGAPVATLADWRPVPADASSADVTRACWHLLRPSAQRDVIFFISLCLAPISVVTSYANLLFLRYLSAGRMQFP